MRREVVSLPVYFPSFSNETRSDLESPKWNDSREFPSMQCQWCAQGHRECKTAFMSFLPVTDFCPLYSIAVIDFC